MKTINITSIRTKLFISLCVVVISIVLFLIILNNFILEGFYLYSKKKSLENVYDKINEAYNNEHTQAELDNELDKISISNNFDILLKSNNGINVYTSNKDFYSLIRSVTIENSKNTEVLKKKDKYIITKVKDNETNIAYIILTATLDNNYKLYIRMPLTAIEEGVKISNKFLYSIAIFIIIIGGVIVSIVSKFFSRPIEELNEIAKKMSNLDFSQKYQENNSDDEIDNLGKSINIMSTKLETTINQLRTTNVELERDIEEKSKIDEMRKSFISDVSHELKTPIALIQGYSEGLIENVNKDEENRKFYAEVILDESTKMDKLVKQLLELMKLEYGEMKLNNNEFDIVELEKEILKKSHMIIEKEEIQVEANLADSIIVLADEFYIEQVLTNYITNAIKYAVPINNVKKMKITNKIYKDRKKVRVQVFNTYDSFSEEDINRIWNRFYKKDESRNREKGGNGIGLALVKAIMNIYGNDFGVKNKAGGVEFYFELDLK